MTFEEWARPSPAAGWSATGRATPLDPLPPTDPGLPTAWTTPVAMSDDSTAVLGRSVTLLGSPTPVVIWRC